MAKAFPGRLRRAFGLSLFLHLLLLLAPLGREGGGLRYPRELNAAGRPSFAPLEVMLAPYVLEMPPSPLAAAERIARPPRLAAALGTDAAGRGEPGQAGAAGGDEPAAALPGIPLDHYFAPDELSQRAKILQDIDPYLGALEDMPGHGKTVIALWINERGGVDRLETESSTLDEPFARAVRDEFLAARFRPAERDGAPVKSRMRVEVEILPRSRFSRSAARESLPSP